MSWSITAEPRHYLPRPQTVRLAALAGHPGARRRWPGAVFVVGKSVAPLGPDHFRLCGRPDFRSRFRR